MTDDIETRVHQLFRVRVERNPDISESTAEALRAYGSGDSFGDDDEVLAAVVNGDKETK